MYSMFRERRSFVKACALGDMPWAEASIICAWGLHGLTPGQRRALLCDGFAAACRGGRLRIAKWLRAKWLTGMEVPQKLADETFYWTCQEGHLHTAQWLVSTLGANPHFNLDAPFRGACHHGRIEVAKWLWSLGDVDLHSGYDSAWPLGTGAPPTEQCDADRPWARMKVAQWLVNLDPTYPWPLHHLKHWSKPRAVWMRAVVRMHGHTAPGGATKGR